MKDLRTLLESADPVRNETPPSEVEVQRMRRAIIAAASESRAIPSLGWTQWMAGAVAIAVVASIGINYARRSQDGPTPTVHGPDAELPVTTPRQLQFVTASGTRIIWIFNPDFEIAGSTR
jgi:hypothetical protein